MLQTPPTHTLSPPPTKKPEPLLEFCIFWYSHARRLTAGEEDGVTLHRAGGRATGKYFWLAYSSGWWWWWGEAAGDETRQLLPRPCVRCFKPPFLPAVPALPSPSLDRLDILVDTPRVWPGDFLCISIKHPTKGRGGGDPPAKCSPLGQCLQSQAGCFKKKTQTDSVLLCS